MRIEGADLVRVVVGRLLKRNLLVNNARFSIRDAYQSGYIGLWKAQRRNNGGTNFEFYAREVIRGTILDAQRDFTGFRRSFGSAQPESVPLYESDEYEKRTPYTQEDLLLANEKLSSVYKIISTLDERDQYIVYHYFLKEETLLDVGEQLGITESRVAQILKEILKKIRRKYENNGGN